MADASGDIVIYGIRGCRRVLELKIVLEGNEHPVADVVYAIDDSVKIEDIMSGIDQNPQLHIGIKKAGRIEKLFIGYLDQIEFQNAEQSAHNVHMKLLGTSILLDQTVKNRSFQDTSLTYQNVIEKVVGGEGGACIWNAGSTEFLPMPVIQYGETDWQFTKRMASRSHSCLIANEKGEMPDIAVGPSKKNNGTFLLNKTFYSVGKLDRFNEIGGEQEGLNAKDFLYYRMELDGDFSLGEMIVFQGMSLIVYKKEITLTNEELVYTYTLSSPNSMYVPYIYNNYFIGHTILGEVLETKAETLKLDLKLSDDEHDKKTAYPYNWKPETGNFAYCMPKTGSTVSLYFADNVETSAAVINCIRKNGASAPKMENTQNKRFTTEHGLVMDLDMEQLYFSTQAPKGEDPFASLNFIDDQAITFLTKGSISIGAVEDITVEANYISMSSYDKLSCNDDASLSPQAAFFMMYFEFDAFGNLASVKCSGSNSYPMISDAPESGEDLVFSKIMWGIIGVVAAVAVAVVAVILAPITVTTAAVVGIACAGAACGGVAIWATRESEKAGGEGYSKEQYFATGSIQALLGSATECAGVAFAGTKVAQGLATANGLTKAQKFGKAATLFAAKSTINAAGNGLQQIADNEVKGAEWDSNLGWAVATSYLWDGGLEGLGKIKYYSKLTDMIDPGAMTQAAKQSAKEIEEQTVKRTAAQSLKTAEEETLSNMKNAKKAADDAYENLRRVRNNKKSTNAARQAANAQNREAQELMKAQRGSYSRIDQAMDVTSFKINQHADEIIQIDKIISEETSLQFQYNARAWGGSVYNSGLVNAAGVYARGEAVNGINALIGSEGTADGSGNAGAAGGNGGQALGVELEPREETWELCTGIQGFVEDVYPDGNKFEGKD